MATLADRRIEQDIMLQQIEDVLRHGRAQDPPAYTLILGAGASFGAVPTAKQMLGIPDRGVVHEECIPAFLYERQHHTKPTAEQLPQIVRAFWARFFAANPNLAAPRISCDEHGIPDSHSVAEAYKGIFDQRRTAGINTPAGAREYLRNITLRRKADSISLNGTHFFLASLLSLQRRAGDVSEDGQPLYVGQRDFARTIFTTNFDPLLQVSLQLFQLLYYMTDRPELLAADGLHTDDHPALHLFYAHGSVHRPFLANTGDEISHLHSNARDLAAYLGQHGVIVLGYSGWDDCLLRAMKEISSFGNNLYWLARGEDSIAPEIERFLVSRPNAFWVPIADGGEFMAALHRRLCPGMAFTELLRNPIPFVRRGLERVSLGEIEALPMVTTRRTSGADGPKPAKEEPPSPEELRLQVVALLEESTRHFVDLAAAGTPDARLKRLEHQADLAYAEKKWNAAIELYGKIIEEQYSPVALRALALFRRGVAHQKEGNPKEAVADYSRTINLMDAPVELLAKALHNRGSWQAEEGVMSEAILDYSRAVELPGASVEQVARSLSARGWLHLDLNERAKATSDFNRVIALEGVPADRVADAFFGRAFLSNLQDQKDAAIEDYDRIINLPGAAAADVGLALFNRGVINGQMGRLAEGISDCGRVISLSGALPRDVAKALVNRAIYYCQQNRIAEAIADYSMVIDLPGAPPEQVAKARLGRGVRLKNAGDNVAARKDLEAALRIPEISEDLVPSIREALAQIPLNRSK